MNPPDAGEAGTVDRLIAEYLAARDAGTARPPEAWAAGHPEHAHELRAFLANERALDARLGPLLDPGAGGFVRPGQRLGGFVLVRPLAAGGMATVWEAEQEGLNRKVAVKLLNAATAPREAVERFRREAEAAAALDHPHIVPIYKVGEQDGVPFFAMKRAAADLRHRLPRYTADPRAAAVLLGKVARAVHHAHLHGVLHRDLKPANILLDDPDGGGPAEPLVADFGLAKHSTGDAAGEATRTGAVLGTPGYMSPEQAAGHGNRGTVLTDVWGLGAVLYALLTGRPPFVGEGEFDTVRKVLAEEPPRPRHLTPGIDADLETVCLKCLDKDPARRYPMAAAVAEELERWLRGESILARPVGPLVRARRWVYRNPYPAALLGVVGLLFVVLAGATAVTLSFNDRLERRNQELNAANGELSGAMADLNASNARLAAAVAAADAARADAEAARELEARNSALAREAIAGYDRIGDAPELSGPGTQVARRLLFLEALKYYERFAAQNEPSGALARDTIEARLKSCYLCIHLDRSEEALNHAAAAARHAEALLAAAPGDATARYQLLRSWSARGLVLKRRKGETEKAVDCWRECLRVGGPLAGVHLDATVALSEAQRNIGRALFDTDPSAAREAFAHARRLADSALRLEQQQPAGAGDRPPRSGSREVSLGSDFVEAQLEAEAGNYSRSVSGFRRVVAGWEAVLAAGGNGRSEVRLAEVKRQYGVLLYQSGAEDPFAVLTDARDRFLRLARANPAVPRHALDAAVCQMSLGNAYLQFGQPAAAVPQFDAALKGLTVSGGGEKAWFDPEYTRFAVFALLGRGRAAAHLGRFADAERDFRHALITDRSAGFVISLFLVEAVCLQGHHAAAADKLRTLVPPSDPRAVPLWIEMALGWVRCAAAAERDATLTEPERKRLLAEYRANAAAALARVPDRDNERVRAMLANPEFCMQNLGPVEPPVCHEK